MAKKLENETGDVVYYVEIIVSDCDNDISFELIFKDYPTRKQLMLAFEGVKDEIENGNEQIEDINKMLDDYGWPELKGNIGYIEFGENEQYGFISIREFPILDNNAIDGEIKIGDFV